MSSEPSHIYIDFKDRSFTNKLARINYRIWRCLFTSAWFYFTPFMFIFLSFHIPYAAQEALEAEDASVTVKIGDAFVRIEPI